MSGLVTLLSERLETIARLWVAGLSAWAYASCEQDRAYRGWIYIGADVSGISKTNEWISFFLLLWSARSWHWQPMFCYLLFHPSPLSWQPSTPTPCSTPFFYYCSYYRSPAYIDNCWWSSRWRLCPAHLRHHSGLSLLQAHRQRWAQWLVWARGSTANSSDLKKSKSFFICEPKIGQFLSNFCATSGTPCFNLFFLCQFWCTGLHGNVK